jgi:hypothetical protein
VFGPVASGSTVSRLIDTLATAREKALTALCNARSVIRSRVWQLSADRAPDWERVRPSRDHRGPCGAWTTGLQRAACVVRACSHLAETPRRDLLCTTPAALAPRSLEA